MTLVVRQSELTELTAAVIDAFAVHGDKARCVTLGKLAPRHAGSWGETPCVVCPERRRVEVLMGETTDLAALAPALRRLDLDDWDVVVLVPLDGLGGAHHELRGTPCRLQPWWRDEAVVLFGALELP